MENIQSVSYEEINIIIESREPLGLYIAREPKGKRRRLFIAVNNLTGEAWTEEFEEFIEAVKWLEQKKR